MSSTETDGARRVQRKFTGLAMDLNGNSCVGATIRLGRSLRRIDACKNGQEIRQRLTGTCLGSVGIANLPATSGGIAAI